VGHRISLKELIPLCLDRYNLPVVLARPLQQLQGCPLGFISVPMGLRLAGLKVDCLCI
jgi:hypothetical protein